MSSISILITDDHKMIREAWEFIFSSHPKFHVIGCTGTGEDAVNLAGKFHPDIVIMDINLPGVSGIDATEQIIQCSPLSRILAVSLHVEPLFAQKIISKGAYGYLTKSSTKREMLLAIDQILLGNKYVCVEIKDALAERVINNDPEMGLHKLSVRELQVVEEIRMGFTSKQIAEKFNLSIKTVEGHRYNVLKKLKLPNVTALVNYVNKH